MMIRLPASSSLSWDRLYLMLYVTKETSMTIVSLFTVKWFDSSSLFKLFLNIFIYIFRLFFFFSVLKPHFLCCLCFLLHCLQKSLCFGEPLVLTVIVLTHVSSHWSSVCVWWSFAGKVLVGLKKKSCFFDTNLTKMRKTHAKKRQQRNTHNKIMWTTEEVDRKNMRLKLQTKDEQNASQGCALDVSSCLSRKCNSLGRDN